MPRSFRPAKGLVPCGSGAGAPAAICLAPNPSACPYAEFPPLTFPSRPQFAVAAAVSMFMTLWRYTKLKESEVWRVERADAVDITEQIEHRQVGFCLGRERP